jgi:UDP-N-acetylmuramoyl-tripeptide--D-alanyl-D-alanine ligase
MPEVWAAFAAGLVAWSALTFIRLRAFLHILQLEEYYTLQFLRWLAANRARYLLPTFLAVGFGGAVAAMLALLLDTTSVVAAAGLLVWGASGAFLFLKRSRRKAKKPLVMTARAKRILYVAGLSGAAVVALVLGAALALAGAREAIVAALIAATAACVASGYLIALANLALYPLEESTRRKFQAQASRKLQEMKPRIIAITGSAGKTTTKDMVSHMLAARFRVLKTPSSFNTPMGISRTVNDSLEHHDFFVVEMGAYQKGEIEKLCRLVGGSDISVITTVNPQHLERFGSLEKTAEAKFEIVEGLKPGGTAVLNFDIPAIREHAALHPSVEQLTFGFQSQDVALRGADVLEMEGGLQLKVVYQGQTVTVRTQLLGRHNAGNVLAAIGVGLVCGLELEYMAAAVRQFHSPEHRLQPMKLANGVTVLDDGYNANPVGIIGALEVLSSYAPRRRILVTPGLIEMGNEKGKYHADIGRAAARTCDVAILVGPKQTADIKAALLETGFPGEAIHVVTSFDGAQAVLATIGRNDDVILYANDLPDQFDETMTI